MRDIKFRQFVDGKWHYWGFGLPDLGSGFASPMKLHLPSYQYTGMKDRNGVEIYEGDIIREKDIVGAVEWTWEHLYRVMNKNGGAGIYPIITGDLRHDNWFEVIGNIHENPELLK